MKMWTKNFSKEYYKKELIEKKYILFPAIKRILKKRKWNSLIDLGCGSGYYCRYFAKVNKRVVGVDSSKTQLEIARQEEKHKKLGIKYIRNNLTNLKSIKSNTFDVALLNFVIVEISNKGAVKKIFREAHRVLKRGGILIIGQVHPHNLNRKNFLVEKTLLNKKKTYFDEGSKAVSKTLLENGKYMFFRSDYHYSLEFILNSLSRAGFFLESLNELSYKQKYPSHVVIVERKMGGV